MRNAKYATVANDSDAELGHSYWFKVKSGAILTYSQMNGAIPLLFLGTRSALRLPQLAGGQATRQSFSLGAFHN